MKIEWTLIIRASNEKLSFDAYNEDVLIGVMLNYHNRTRLQPKTIGIQDI